jgi:hypothetical protein
MHRLEKEWKDNYEKSIGIRSPDERRKARYYRKRLEQ